MPTIILSFSSFFVISFLWGLLYTFVCNFGVIEKERELAIERKYPSLIEVYEKKGETKKITEVWFLNFKKIFRYRHVGFFIQSYIECKFSFYVGLTN